MVKDVLVSTWPGGRVAKAMEPLTPAPSASLTHRPESRIENVMVPYLKSADLPMVSRMLPWAIPPLTGTSEQSHL